MAIFVGALGALQILGAAGAFFLLGGPSREIVGAIMIGLGVATFAIAVLIERSDRQADLLQQIAKKLS